MGLSDGISDIPRVAFNKCEEMTPRRSARHTAASSHNNDQSNPATPPTNKAAIVIQDGDSPSPESPKAVPAAARRSGRKTGPASSGAKPLEDDEVSSLYSTCHYSS